MAEQNQASSGDPEYTFKPTLIGAAWQFRLGRSALDWNFGSRSGSVPFRQITRIRMSYRPMTLQTHRFITEIWSSSGPRLQIASTSWKSMVEHHRLDTDYAGFVTELHRRIAAAGTQASFESGFAAPLYWTGLAVFIATAFGLAALTVRALQLGAWAGATFIGIFFAAFLWQVGSFFHRNRPGTYRPEAPPVALLPRG